MQVGLAEKDGACFFQFHNNHGVMFGHEIRQDLGPSRCTNALHIDVVFQRNRNSVEWAAITLPFTAARGKELSFRFFCLGESELWGNGEVGV